jgi:1,4-alpha-glucan branching enzyme
MAGDDWKKFTTLHLLCDFMDTQLGKKNPFMGAEIGHWAERNHEGTRDWILLEYGEERAKEPGRDRSRPLLSSRPPLDTDLSFAALTSISLKPGGELP